MARNLEARNWEARGEAVPDATQPAIKGGLRDLPGQEAVEADAQFKSLMTSARTMAASRGNSSRMPQHQATARLS